MEDIHVYLDEKYSDTGTVRQLQVTSLTGVTMSSSQLVPFRKIYFDLLRNLFPSPVNRIPMMAQVHASELFPEESDSLRFSFMEELVSVVNCLGLQIRRAGYRRNNDLNNLFETTNPAGNYHEFEKTLMSLCFLAFQPPVNSSGPLTFFHMESDGSNQQLDVFQRSATRNQWFREFVSAEGMSINTDRIGDVSFYAKGSPYGVLPDCMGYLLHLRWRNSEGDSLSPYQSRMLEICNAVDEGLVCEEIVDICMMNSAQS